MEWKNAYLKQSYQQAFSQFDNILYKNSFPVRKLRQILENVSFETFKEQLETWFLTAKFVWYITGNISKEVALELIEKSNKAFETNHVAIDDFAKVTPMSVAGGKAHYVESPLDDKSNENSCVLTNFESGLLPSKDSNRLKLINQVLMNYI